MYTLYMITQILNVKNTFKVIASEIDRKNCDPLRILRVKVKLSSLQWKPKITLLPDYVIAIKGALSRLFWTFLG